jgi:hypothetical protein
LKSPEVKKEAEKKKVIKTAPKTTKGPRAQPFVLARWRQKQKSGLGRRKFVTSYPGHFGECLAWPFQHNMPVKPYALPFAHWFFDIFVGFLSDPGHQSSPDVCSTLYSRRASFQCSLARRGLSTGPDVGPGPLGLQQRGIFCFGLSAFGSGADFVPTEVFALVLTKKLKLKNHHIADGHHVFFFFISKKVSFKTE